MAKFSINDRVTHVGSGAKGIITGVFPPRGTRRIYNVTWIGSGNEEMCLESNLTGEIKIDNAFDMVANGIFGSFSDYARINTESKIANTSINTISSLKASKTIFKAYQYKPLLKFLNSDNRRLLVADEVGLGKTIEAGHVLMEMNARNELQNSLIICPKSLAEKWQFELNDKFAIRYKIYERKSDLVSDIKNGNAVLGIITYEKLRKSGKDDINTAVIEKHIQMDIVICDEAHKLRNDGTATYDAVQELLYSTKSALFLTATPIMLGEENLYNLMHLLDPDRFDNSYVFHDLINANKPFIRALYEINANVPFAKIAEHLDEATIRYEDYSVDDEEEEEEATTVHDVTVIKVKDEYKDVPLYQKIMEELSNLPENTESRVQIQNDISSISVLNNIFSRTRKKEVTTDWSQAVRRPQTITATLSEEETSLYDQAIKEFEENYLIEHAGDTQGMELPLSTLRRKLASSVYGQLMHWEDGDCNYEDAKFEALMKVVRKTVLSDGKKLIVFSTFRRTLGYLSRRLEMIGIKSVVIHGEIKNRADAFSAFQHDPSLRILLSSEVGSEGLDMQFCESMVNYDLPWNPMVVEQRIGRIDRFGQKSPSVNIYTITVKGTVQEKIYNRLLERIGIFKECIGDIEVILDRYCEKYNQPKDFLNDLEMELESKDLTEEEKNEKIDNICKAMLNVKKDLDEISEGLTDTLTNDMYFKEEISRITETGRYITEEEIRNFVCNLIDNALPACRLEKVDEDTYNFRVPSSSQALLKNFMVKYQPQTADADYKRFLMETAFQGSFTLTFDQEYAFYHKQVEYINAYHPLVIAAFNFFKEKEVEVRNAFNFELPRESSEKLMRLPEGDYLMAIYQVNIEKHIYNTVQNNTVMVPLLYQFSSGGFIEDRGLSELVFGQSQKAGRVCGSACTRRFGKDISFDFTEAIDGIQEQMVRDIKIHLDSNKSIQKLRTSKYYDKRISALRTRIMGYKYSLNQSEQRLVPALEAQVRNLVEEKQLKLDSIDNYSIKKIPETLVSVSLVHLT